VGQRGGIKLPGGPWYVVRKDTALNALHVSREYHAPAAARRDAFAAGPFSWIGGVPPDPALPLQVKLRHGPHMYACRLELGTGAAASGSPGGGSEGAPSAAGRVYLEGSDQGIAAGQLAVFYQEGVCLGSAPIQGALDAPAAP
jgi:tRNA-specific 2-thiouridylase